MASIFDTISGDENYSVLSYLILLADQETGAGLEDALDSDGLGATLFAPVDDIMFGIVDSLGFTGTSSQEAAQFLLDALDGLTGGNGASTLVSVLTYHVSPEELAPEDVAEMTSVSTLLGPDLGVDTGALVDLEPDNINALLGKLTEADNGNVIPLNNLLIPADLDLPPGAFVEGSLLDVLSSEETNPDTPYPGLFEGDEDPTDNIDNVTGTEEADVISTGDDADTIDGLGGDDILDGGVDDDTINGGNGNDTITGSEGNDVIDGGDGDDTIFGGLDPSFPDIFNIEDDNSGLFGPDLAPVNGRDTLFGGEGNDTIFGGEDRDFVLGEEGDDTLDGGLDRDIVRGGKDNDNVEGGQANDGAIGGSGDDFVSGGSGNDFVSGNSGDDIVSGGDGDDRVFGRTGDDFLDGGSGDDVVFGHKGGDQIFGGDGNDKLNAGSGDDYVTGGDGHDRVTGNSGDDIVEGGGGNDIVLGRDGNDILRGGNGRDILKGDDGDDVLGGGEGDDTLIGGDGSDRFVFSEEKGANTITDFVFGDDTVKILIDGTINVDTEAGDGNDALITVEGNEEFSVLLQLEEEADDDDLAVLFF